MTPDQFWRLTLREFWWLVEANRKPKMYGDLTEEQVAELYEDA